MLSDDAIDSEVEGPGEQPHELAAGDQPPPPASNASNRLIPRWAQYVGFPLVVIAFLGSVIHTSDYSLGPGPATNVLSLIQVKGEKTYSSKGQLLITTASVSDHALTVWDWVWAWVNPNLTTINRKYLIPPGVNDKQNLAQNMRDMEDSKAAAEAAAFRALGKKVTILPGALVIGIEPNSPASGKLFENDLILSVDGARTPNPVLAVAAIRKRKIGEKVTLSVRRGTKVVTVVLPTVSSKRVPKKAAIGVTIDTGQAYILPDQVLIDTQQIGGPSGGLVFALSIYDAFTPADLTHGHIIAVTGTISADGSVGPIGAIEEKIRGAHAAHADVFIAPSKDGEAAQARKIAPAGMRVIGVATLSEAIAALRDLQPRSA